MRFFSDIDEKLWALSCCLSRTKISVTSHMTCVVATEKDRGKMRDTRLPKNDLTAIYKKIVVFWWLKSGLNANQIHLKMVDHTLILSLNNKKNIIKGLYSWLYQKDFDFRAVLGRWGHSQKILWSAISMLLFRTVFFWLYVKNEWKIGFSWYPSIRTKKLNHIETEIIKFFGQKYPVWDQNRLQALFQIRL